MIVQKKQETSFHITLSEKETEVLYDFLFEGKWPTGNLGRVDILTGLYRALREVR